MRKRYIHKECKGKKELRGRKWGKYMNYGSVKLNEYLQQKIIIRKKLKTKRESEKMITNRMRERKSSIYKGIQRSRKKHREWKCIFTKRVRERERIDRCR